MNAHPIDERLPSTSERWGSVAFREELLSWVADQVGEVRAAAPVRLRPWSTVWRVETAGGVFFAKQNCGPQNHEAALLAALVEIAPDHVVPLAAADLDRGLLLTPDQGPTMADRGALADVDAWCEVARTAALLQREAASHADRLAATGLTTMVPTDAVAYVEQRVAELGDLPAGDPRRLAESEAVGVRARLPEIAEWSAQVAALGLPLTMSHNDLHGHNVFVGGDGLRFFDFGDAMLAEPLGVLLIPRNVLSHELGCDVDDPRVARMTDAALDVWSDIAPLPELRAALPGALELARLARCESWIRCLPTMTAAELQEHGAAPASWLGTLRSGGA